MSESNSRSNVFQISRAFACVPSRWKALSGEFRRRPTELAIKFRKPDRVGRRGLSEPREDFSRLPTYAWTQKWFVQIFGESNSRSNVFQISRASACVPSRWKVLSGEFRRRPTGLAKESSKPDCVGRRGLSEPREDFSRLLTNHTARLFCPSNWRNHAVQIP